MRATRVFDEDAAANLAVLDDDEAWAAPRTDAADPCAETIGPPTDLED